MRKRLFIVIAAMISLSAMADTKTDKPQQIPDEVSRYDLFVFQNPEMEAKFRERWNKQTASLQAKSGNRSLIDDLFAATKQRASNMSFSSVSSIVQTGISVVGDMVRSKKNDWIEVMKRENEFKKTIMTLQNLDDFYSGISTVSALDPSNISFNGFGCHQKRGDKTVLYLACHLDTTENAFSRIFRHSKFQLQVDTLIFNPALCDLPNDATHELDTRRAFSFKERANLNLEIGINITSSWINQAIQVYNDQHLGQFKLRVPISPEELSDEGEFRFVRGEEGNSVRDVQLQGECFIVPRSYVGVCDDEGNFSDAWGTGQYRVEMTIKETCDINEDMLEGSNWKADWKFRKEHKRKKNNDVLKTYAQQVWDKNASQWVVSLIDAPASLLTTTLLNSIGIESAQQSAANQAKKAAQKR